MKKQRIQGLALNKKSISNLGQSSLKGGSFVSCHPVGICGLTGRTGCLTDFPCPPPPPLTQGCPTISCDPVAICPR